MNQRNIQKEKRKENDVDFHYTFNYQDIVQIYFERLFYHFQITFIFNRFT